MRGASARAACRAARVTIWAIFLVSSLSPVASAAPDNAQVDPITNSNIAVLPLPVFASGFRLCSRSVPQSMSGFWEVSPSEAAKADVMLGEYFRRDMRARRRLTLPLAEYGRQYVGFVRDGVRWIYVNAFVARKRARLLARARSEFIRGCDGGGLFWGIELSTKTWEFSRFAINGDAE
jgi:hypothetical protein